MSEFAVANGRRLMHARSGFEADDAVAFVFELDPSFQHIHELKGRSVQMRLTGEGVSLCGANQMRIDATVGRLLDSEIAIFEEGPEPALREWRRALAQKQGVPAFRIMSDRVLIAIAQNQPRSAAELLAIPGIGIATVEKYGAQLYRILNQAR